MQKKWRLFIWSLFLFMFSITSGFAKEISLQTLGDLVVDSNPNAESFYVIGKYVFTMKYVGQYQLNAQDLMIAARSIDVGGAEEIKGTDAYKKMSVYQIVSKTDDDGNVTGWEVSKNNLYGEHQIDNNTLFTISYIDYVKVKDIYTVTFQDDEGRELAKKDVISGKTVKAPDAGTREGYDFAGWYKESEKIDFSSKTITEDLTVKQKWEIHKYTVIIDKDNTEDSTTEKVDYKGHVSKPGDPSKEGYDFKGWYKCNSLTDCSNIATATVEFDFTGTEIKEDIKIQAKWEIQKFTVSFDKNQADSVNIEDQTIEYGKTAKEPNPAPTRTGYKFLGWFKCDDFDSCTSTAEESFQFTSELIKDNVKLQAKWEQIQRKVIFKAKIDGEEQSDVLDKTEITLTYPFKLDNNQLPKIKEPEGYEFIKWTKNGVTIDGITNHIFTDKESTIVGEWKTKSFTITFKKDDKSIYREFAIKYKNSIPADAFVDLDKPSTQLYNSFKFKGWYKCDDATCGTTADTVFDFGKDGQEVKENMTFIAKYEQIVNTSEIMSNFTEQLKSEDFSAFVSAKNITLNILKKDTNLQTNFNKLVTAMQKVIAVNNVTKVEIGYEGKTKVLDSDNANRELTNLITTLSGQSDLANSTINKLDGKTFTIKLTLTEGIKNQENDLENNSVTYTVKFNTEGFVYVNSAEELEGKLSGDEEIIIAKNFDIPNKITITGDVVIDGNNKTLTSTITGKKYTFEITSGNVTIKDLTLKIDTLLPSEYNKKTKTSNVGIKNTIGFKVGSAASLTITNVKVDGSKTIDRDNLTITGTGESINQVENFNSTNVVINENAAIELEGTLSGSGLTYTSEIYGSPAVLSKASDEIETAHMNLGKMNRQTYIFNITERKNSKTEGHDVYDRVKNYVHYYGSYDNSYVATVLYIYDRNMNPFFYLYNETLIEPLTFQDGGVFNMNEEDKKFTDWLINSGRVSSEELVAIKITNSNGINTVAQYSK